ncbi:MAG: cell division cycle protein 14, partial [Monoraphidium minutum]
MMDEFAEAVEIVQGRYYMVSVRNAEAVSRSAIAAANLAYCIDSTLLYEPFYQDFGPLNLGRTYRFCEITSRLLQEAEQRGKRLYLYCGPQPQQRANAAVLVGAFQVLLLGWPADAALLPLAPLKPFMNFRDATCGAQCFPLQVQDCLRGLEKAVAAGFLDVRGGAWRFDIDEYEHYEQVENGDLNWIVPGKLAAFSGPAAHPNVYVGFRAMVPEDYWEYYRRRRVTAVVRLNKKVYDRKRFLDGGLRHHELYFPDGSCPPTELLLRFLDIAEQEPGALAIHCKAGLGRTGVLICAYIMKHYGFTAEEAIGYIRVCRPGSVIGPQQNYLKEIQPLMWREGDAHR